MYEGITEAVCGVFHKNSVSARSMGKFRLKCSVKTVNPGGL